MTCTSGRCLVSLHCHKSSSYITVVPLEETEVLAVWVGYWDTWILDYSGHSTDIAVGAEAPPLHLENTELPDQEKTTNFFPSQATVNYQSLAMNLSCWLSAHSAALKFPFTITLYVDLKKKTSMSILSNFNRKQTQCSQFSRVSATHAIQYRFFAALWKIGCWIISQKCSNSIVSSDKLIIYNSK